MSEYWSLSRIFDVISGTRPARKSDAGLKKLLFYVKRCLFQLLKSKICDSCLNIDLDIEHNITRSIVTAETSEIHRH